MASRNSIALACDADGELTSDGANSYSRDAENRLVGIAYPNGNKTRFSYDGRGRRVQIAQTADRTIGGGADMARPRRAGDDDRGGHTRLRPATVASGRRNC